MTIYTNNLIVHGTFSGSSLHTNNMSSGDTAPINITSDIKVTGNVSTQGRIETGSTLFMTMRVPQDITMRDNEHFIIDTDMILDLSSSDAQSITSIADYTTIWNWENGTFTVPISGLYTLQIQASFENTVPDTLNGVYFYFVSSSYPDARAATNIVKSSIVYTNTSQFLKKGDIIKPVFFSTDKNATIKGNGESYLSFLIPSTLTNLDPVTEPLT